MSGRLADKTAVVIGAARGIGAGIAERFAEEGARLAIADVSRAADAEALVAQTLRQYGRIDILVQNAGIYPWTLIEHTSVEEWDAVLGVNLRGAFIAARACLGPMRQQGYGRMVFTSSITGPRVSSPGHGHYSASKAGINGFIRAAAIEFAGHGITVNGVEPGNILTEGMRAHRSAEFIAAMEASVPLGRLGTPRDVANACLFLASDEAGYITGTTLIVDGGQILPESQDFRILPSEPAP